jgi:hypothetical protein
MGRASDRSAETSPRHSRGLNLDGAETYDCPVCRHGQLEAMALMDAYACSFCRHIFEANLDQQTIHVADGVQPMGWRWQGLRWQPLHQSRSDVTVTLWVVGVVLVVLPAGLVALGGYLFPPLENTTEVNWSLVWATITLVAHGGMVGWLLAEHYQFPLYVLTKIRLQRWLERLPG